MDSPTPISITLFGDGATGKSSLTLSLIHSTFLPTYDPTIEDSYSLTRRYDGHEYILSITDTAGQEEYRGLWAGDALRADGFVLVYDITNRESLNALEWFEQMVAMEGEMRAEKEASAAEAAAAARSWSRRGRHGQGRSRANTAGTGISGRSGRERERDENRGIDDPGIGFGLTAPVKIVAGNKCDLSTSRQVSAREGLEWARRRGCGFMETSAREGVNVEETFGLIVRRVVENRRRAREMGLELRRDLEVYEGDGERRTDSVQRKGTRRAVTAPLSPLAVGEGGEKIRMRLPPSGGVGPGERKGWGWLRCW
jgi:GTPase KRas protein